MPAPDIHAVIWDFGGVISSSPFEAFAAYERAHGLPANFLRTVNATNHLDNAWARFERSDIDLATFDAEFAAESAALGHAVRGKDVIALLSGTIRPQMVQALRVLRPRLKIGLITNNVASPGAENADPTGRDAVLPLCTPDLAARVSLATAPDDLLIHTSWGQDFASHPSWSEWFTQHEPTRRIDPSKGHRVGSSLLAIDFASREAAMAWLADEPFTRAGLYAATEVHAFVNLWPQKAGFAP